MDPIPAAVKAEVVQGQRGKLMESPSQKVKAPDSQEPESDPSGEAPQKSDTNLIGRYEARRSGGREFIDLSDDDKEGIITRIQKRREEAKRLQYDEKRLTAVDEMVLNLSEEEMTKFKNGELSPKLLMIAYTELQTELLQKSLALGRAIQEEKVPAHYRNRFLRLPFLRRIMERPAELRTVLEGSAVTMTSEYTRKGHYDTWGVEAEEDLLAINKLRVNLEQSIFGRTFEDPLFDSSMSSLYPATSGKIPRNILRSEAMDHLAGILQRDYGNARFEDLQRERPQDAMQALHQAMEQAIFTYSPQVAKDLLIRERPEGNTTRIEAFIKKLQDPEKQKAELEPLTEAKTKAEAETTRAQEVFDTRSTRLKTILDSELPNAEKALTKATDRSTALRANYAAQATYWEGQVAGIDARVEPPGLTASGKDQFHSKKSSELENARQKLREYRQKIEQLDEDVTNTRSARDILLAERAALEGRATNPNSIRSAQRQLTRGTAAEKAASDALAAKQKEHSEGPSDIKKLEQWENVQTPEYYKKLIKTLLGQNIEDEYRREYLARTNQRNGQIEGAELLRKLIFDQGDNADYDPNLAREMLSDEALARAIIWTYKLNPSQLLGPTTTRADILDSIKDAKAQVATMAATDPLRQPLLDSIKAQEHQIIQDVLPSVLGSKMQLGDLVRFIVHQGIQDAANGKPDLTLDESFIRPEQTLRVRREAPGIYREGIGTAHIDARNYRVAWDNQVRGSELADAFETAFLPTPVIGTNAEQPLHYRTTAEINRQGANSRLEVEINDSLISYLPSDWALLRTALNGVAAINPDFNARELRNAFHVLYDTHGHLRNELRGGGLGRLFAEGRLAGIPQWITIGLRENQTIPGMINTIDGEVTPLAHDTLTFFPSAVADKFLQEPPSRRQEIIKSLRPTTHIDAAGTTRIITYKDGILTITNPATGNSAELSQFYEDWLQDFKTNVFHTEDLNAAQKQQVKTEMLGVQEALGREIMYAIQRR